MYRLTLIAVLGFLFAAAEGAIAQTVTFHASPERLEELMKGQSLGPWSHVVEGAHLSRFTDDVNMEFGSHSEVEWSVQLPAAARFLRERIVFTVMINRKHEDDLPVIRHVSPGSRTTGDCGRREGDRVGRRTYLGRLGFVSSDGTIIGIGDVVKSGGTNQAEKQAMSALLREGFTVTAKRVRPIRRHVETANERGGYLREINLAPDSRFVKVRVYHKPGHHVSRIDVWWQDGGGNVFKQRIGRGEDSHASVEIKLPDDVAITRIEGYAGDNIIETIRVRTSDGQDTGMLGEDDVRNLRHFVINVPQASEATGLYFRSGKFVNAVGVEWDDPTSR